MATKPAVAAAWASVAVRFRLRGESVPLRCGLRRPPCFSGHDKGNRECQRWSAYPLLPYLCYWEVAVAGGSGILRSFSWTCYARTSARYRSQNSEHVIFRAGPKVVTPASQSNVKRGVRDQNVVKVVRLASRIFYR